MAAAEERFGAEFAQILAVSNIWLNGDPVEPDAPVRDEDELAVIPPVSGG
jgi:molybdopterin synthase sulfur carrier subunit